MPILNQSRELILDSENVGSDCMKTVGVII